MTALDRLSQMIPSDIALANKALAISMKGITGISNTQLPIFAKTVSNTQTMVGLPLVNAQTSAVSPATANYYSNMLAKGSSVNNTFVISDFLGTAAGLPGTQALIDTLAIFNQMDLSYLTLIYQTMVNVLNGDYNVPNETEPEFNDVLIPNGLPAAGRYFPTIVIPAPPPEPPPPPYVSASGATAALIGQLAPEPPLPGLIAAANDEIARLVSAYPTQTTQLNQLWTELAQSLIDQPANQARANLVWNQLISNSQSSMLSLILSLPDYGQDTSVGGQAEFFKLLADPTTLAGQCIIGLFRQGPTTTALKASGIYTNNDIPSDPTPPPPQADLGPTSYPYP